MKSTLKQILTTLVLITIPIHLNATEPTPQQNPDFRSVRWGMSRDQVLKAENRPAYIDNETGIAFNDQLASLPVYLGYIFQEGQLVESKYTVKTEYTLNASQYVGRYDLLKSLLARKYGEPYIDEVNWVVKKYKKRKNRLSKAILAGHVIHQSEWETERTRIRLKLYGENARPKLVIHYTDKAYATLDAESATQADLDKL